MPVTDRIILRREPGHFVRSLAALLLRGGLGMIFLIGGLQKYNQMRSAGIDPGAEVLRCVQAMFTGGDTAETGEVAEADEMEADTEVEAEAEAEAETAEADTEAADTEAAEGEGGDGNAPPAEEGAADGVPGGEQAEESGPKYPASVRGMFEPTWLGRRMPRAVDLHTALLPFVEIGVGALLIAGLLTTLSSFLSGLVLLSLLFGWIVQQNTGMYPNMLIYLLVNVGILWLSPVTSNYLSIDGLLFGWFWRPRTEAEVAEAREDQQGVRVS